MSEQSFPEISKGKTDWYMKELNRSNDSLVIIARYCILLST